MTGGNRMRLALAGAVVALAAGCSSDRGHQQQGEGLRIAVQTVRGIGQPRAAAPTGVPAGLTRAAIDGSPLPLLMATIEATGATAVLGLSNTNAGTQSYATSDRVVITLRDGVVISTAGFGPDLRSSAGPTGRQVAAGAGATRRVHDYLDGTDTMFQVALDCTLAPGGSETVTLFERAYATRIVTETCANGVQNRYWIEGSGKIRQSRQWIGADLGYLKIADLSR
ncbi:YjbF family lipoprotein [Ruixingdingia sedimenti]|uniref:YjbF family lipoprotein n=1 Tax=Ruixingdingia sedimenti TaxID=3073604 RepID=A0ABU1F7H0_9RHOB|nr:YjbF family lipoprotein [Xinfangfangia sp. LG-4]MDR5652382.1 YjbF family lipoprotein [Xinfangfangia sp. LG-4]